MIETDGAKNPSGAFSVKVDVRKLDHGRDHDVESAIGKLFSLLPYKELKAIGVEGVKPRLAQSWTFP